MKTNFEHRLELKRLAENKERILLFHSGIFYKTFESDAEFLSALFGFQVLEKGGYETVGFPVNTEEKYLEQLKQAGYSYQIIKNMEGELGLLDEFDGSEVLVYEKNKVVFWEKKEEPLPKPLYDTRFQGFIQDLEKLVQKYL